MAQPFEATDTLSSCPGGTPVTETLERVKTYKQFIGGEFVDAADGKTADVINPANLSVTKQNNIGPNGSPCWVP